MGKDGLQSETFPFLSLFLASAQEFFLRQAMHRRRTACRTEQSRSRTFEEMASFSILCCTLCSDSCWDSEVFQPSRAFSLAKLNSLLICEP